MTCSLFELKLGYLVLKRFSGLLLFLCHVEMVHLDVHGYIEVRLYAGQL